MRDGPHPTREAHRAGESLVMVRRGLVMLAFMTFWAFVVTPGRAVHTLLVLTAVAAVADVVVAALRAQKLIAPSISHWDSAAGFFLIHLLLRAAA